MVLGAMVGSGFVLRLNDLFSWEMSIVAVSLTVLVFSLPAWVLKQDHPVTVKSTGTTVVERPGVAAWRRFLGHDRIGPMVLAIVCFGMAAGADVLVPALLIDRGYSASEAGWLLGTVATGSVIPASFAMGYLLRRFGVIAVMGLLYVAKAGVLFALIWAVHFSPATVAALAIGDFCLAGALTVGTWQLYMNFASREHSATDYGLMTSLDAFLRFLGGLSAGQVAVYIGYGSVFAGAALGALGACFFCFLLRERHSAEAGR
ncbi:MFS transporter [Nitratireductor aquibiodomus]|uniref:MFS transporter n=1 Tax=Nitratireductor aquibiodomus TaxID=204799 RepID=UPI0009DF445C|nr:MFS transporter [Nitratireductor aquibiodomus]